MTFSDKRAVGLGMAALLVVLAGCEDKGKISEKGAAAQIGQVVATVDQDIAELERGLPVGAERRLRRFSTRTAIRATI